MLKNWGPATVLVVGLVLIVAVVGGIVVVANPDSLSFDDYIKALVGAGVASGLLGVGRGIHEAAKTGAGEPDVDTGSPGVRTPQAEHVNLA